MFSNGTFVATLFDATSVIGLTNVQINYIANGTFTNVTRRLRDYFVASNSLYSDPINNVTEAGMITLFKLDFQLNSIVGSLTAPKLGEYIWIGYDSTPDSNN